MSFYATFLILFFGLPLFVIILVRRDIFRYRRTFFWSLAAVYTIGFFWDWLSVKTGVWRYDSAPTFGIWLDGIPLEEFLGFYTLGTLFIVSTILVILKHFRHVR